MRKKNFMIISGIKNISNNISFHDVTRVELQIDKTH